MESNATIVCVKGFDANLQCRGFQFEIGGTYTHTGPVQACSSGFHACENPLAVWSYYSPVKSRFAVVELSGATSRDDTKIAAATITIKAEIKLPELIRKAAAWIIGLAKGNTATGDSGHAAATGYSGHAAATGYYGHAAATGEHSIAASFGKQGTGMVGKGGWLVLAAYDSAGKIICVKAAKEGGEEGVEAGVKYRLTQTGKFVKAS